MKDSPALSPYSRAARFEFVDTARGVALVLMIFYHFCFDLTLYGFSQEDFSGDTFWVSFRAIIVSLFLLLVGVSSVLAFRPHIPRRVRGRALVARQGKLLVALVLVTLASYYYSSQRYIYFGILHFIFVASVLNVLFRRWFLLNLLLGALVIYLGTTHSSLMFHSWQLKWLGFQMFKPHTYDFVPLFPWYGVVLLGLFLGHLIFSRTTIGLSIDRGVRAASRAPTLSLPLRTLRALGRHSLLIYVVHQPMIIGVLAVLRGLHTG